LDIFQAGKASMASPFRVSWHQRILFFGTCALSAGLLAFVLAAPLLVRSMPERASWSQLAGLFAGDVALRRITAASAIGLLVTACVFFRPPPSFQSMNRKPRRLKLPPPPRVAGA